MLEVEERADDILLKPVPEINIGKVAGKNEYEEVIGELDRLRSEWR